MTHTIANKQSVNPNTSNKLFSKALIGKTRNEGAMEVGVKFGILLNFHERDIERKFFIKIYTRFI